MVTVHLEADIDSPFVELADEGVAVEVDEETVERWQVVDAAFREAQKEMWAAYRAAI